MSLTLYALAVVPLGAFAAWLIYDRFFSASGIKRRAAERRRQENGAQARRDLFDRMPD